MDKPKFKDKLSSRRFQITVWAICLVTFLAVYSLITEYSPDWMPILLPILAALPSVYIGFTSNNKINSANLPPAVRDLINPPSDSGQ